MALNAFVKSKEKIMNQTGPGPGNDTLFDHGHLKNPELDSGASAAASTSTGGTKRKRAAGASTSSSSRKKTTRASVEEPVAALSPASPSGLPGSSPAVSSTAAATNPGSDFFQHLSSTLSFDNQQPHQISSSSSFAGSQTHRFLSPALPFGGGSSGFSAFSAPSQASTSSFSQQSPFGRVSSAPPAGDADPFSAHADSYRDLPLPSLALPALAGSSASFSRGTRGESAAASSSGGNTPTAPAFSSFQTQSNTLPLYDFALQHPPAGSGGQAGSSSHQGIDSLASAAAAVISTATPSPGHSHSPQVQQLSTAKRTEGTAKTTRDVAMSVRLAPILTPPAPFCRCRALAQADVLLLRLQLIHYHLSNARANPSYHLPPSLIPTHLQRTIPHGPFFLLFTSYCRAGLTDALVVTGNLIGEHCLSSLSPLPLFSLLGEGHRLTDAIWIQMV